MHLFNNSSVNLKKHLIKNCCIHLHKMYTLAIETLQTRFSFVTKTSFSFCSTQYPQSFERILVFKWQINLKYRKDFFSKIPYYDTKKQALTSRMKSFAKLISYKLGTSSNINTRHFGCHNFSADQKLWLQGKKTGSKPGSFIRLELTTQYPPQGRVYILRSTHFDRG